MGWKDGVVVGVAMLLSLGAGAQQSQAGTTGRAEFGSVLPSVDARVIAQWAMESNDAAGKPFAIVDKKGARLYVFRADGHLAGATAVLLGSAKGDDSFPGVGQRTQSGTVAPHERTTPAGRFLSVPGRNLDGEQVVWVDYSAAFAIHRVRPGGSRRQRDARLASPTPHDNRDRLAVWWCL